ncbi:phage minor head protein [Kitasatospora aureofaciens]|uniref:phage minor head protein n=1 Tax=Kitasatospora aureofaciens TaxID=1894 RepID=UPI0004CC660E|nr:phage minor head protein [Kitasatospora aureofaciens]
MAPADPWLAARMRDRSRVAAAERELTLAVGEAVRGFLAEVRAGLGLGGAVTAAGAPSGGGGPDWSGWPGESRWRRLVQQHIAPVWRRIWQGAYGRTAPDAPKTGRVDDEAEPLADRLRAFPRQVWDRMRQVWRDGVARGGSTGELRARLAELATLEQWDGSVLTMTRTETIGALNSGSLGAALDAQARTGRRWTKRWLATHDDRTRATHRAADGQTVPLNERFDVGGAHIQFPGDPRGPAGEVINCRCSMQLAPAE